MIRPPTTFQHLQPPIRPGGGAARPTRRQAAQKFIQANPQATPERPATASGARDRVIPTPRGDIHRHVEGEQSVDGSTYAWRRSASTTGPEGQIYTRDASGSVTRGEGARAMEQTVTHTGPHGGTLTVERSASLSRTEDGRTRSFSRVVTGPNGKTYTLEATRSVSRGEDGALSVQRSVTRTGPEGQTKTIDQAYSRPMPGPGDRPVMPPEGEAAPPMPPEEAQATAIPPAVAPVSPGLDVPA